MRLEKLIKTTSKSKKNAEDLSKANETSTERSEKKVKINKKIKT